MKFGVPLGRVPLGRVPLGRVPLGRVPLGRVPLGRVPLGRVPLGRVPKKLRCCEFKGKQASKIESTSLCCISYTVLHVRDQKNEWSVFVE